jgi:hypothetical protein
MERPRRSFTEEYKRLDSEDLLPPNRAFHFTLADAVSTETWRDAGC